MYQLKNNVDGLAKYLKSLNPKQLKIVEFLITQKIVINNLKQVETLQKFLTVLTSYDPNKMYGIFPLSQVNELVKVKQFLNEEFNESGTTIGFNKLIKLNDKLVVVYTKNNLNTSGGKQYSPFHLGSYWLGMS
jgi:hypothetical protein